MNLRGALAVLALVDIGAADCWAWAPPGTNGSAALRSRSCRTMCLPSFVHRRRPPKLPCLAASLTARRAPAERTMPSATRRTTSTWKVMGVLSLADLPSTREDYDTDLRKTGFTQYKAGYLPLRHR
jgi:hypothetical protein